MSDDTSKDETVTTSTIGETEMKQFFSAFLAVMILAGCANTMPLIDMKSSGNPAEAQEDWIHCERLADLAEPTGEAVVTGALWTAFGSAATMAGLSVLGYVSGDFTTGTAAAIGAVGGLIGGALNSWRVNGLDQDAVTLKCLEGRGHTVLKL